MKQLISIGIVCYREGEQLSEALNSLKVQSRFDCIGEVLLVQNGNCEITLKTAKAFLSVLPLFIRQNPLNSIGKARRLIVEHSRYALLAFIDADCVAPANWLEKLLCHWDSLGSQNTVAIGGPNRLPEHKFWQKTFNLSLQHPLGHGWSPQAWIPRQKTPVRHMPTTNSLFLREEIIKAGNFSDAKRRVGEDLDLSLRLSRRGALYLFPDPVVLNDFAPNYLGLLKRLFRFGTVQYWQKDLLLVGATSFFLGFLAASVLAEWFFPLLFGIYFVFLFVAALQQMRQSQAASSCLMLPVFWFLQHLAYSLGVVWGLFKAFKTWPSKICYGQNQSK